jgi:NADH-quinone oxidoreductase subunit G
LQIITNSDPAFDSYFSGDTTDICPVGALTTADFRFGARPWEMKSAASICTHCPVGCNLTYNTRREQKANGKVVIKRAMPRQNEQVNETWLCDKGRFGYHFMESDERITQPMVNRNGKLEPVSWDEALDLAAEKLRTFNFNLTTLVGGRLSNEDFYALKELTDVLHGKKVLFGNMAGGDIVSKVGVGQGTNLGDLGKGSVILVISCDLHEEAPVWWMRVLAAVKRGASLITVNAHKTRLEKFAQVKIRSEYGQESIVIQQIMPDSSIASSDYQTIRSMVRDAENFVIFFWIRRGKPVIF